MLLLRWIKRTVTRNRANAGDEIIEEQPSIIRNSDGPTPTSSSTCGKRPSPSSETGPSPTTKPKVARSLNYECFFSWLRFVPSQKNDL
ncbi:hypothetical protein BaRGS_00036263 [Batillaria attramentaria]|uniref:Uncharacterized protein n=1 Tax=Batillaria attramentaria TaxID=370345 RepID=A0ABD0JDK8_9CAEN